MTIPPRKRIPVSELRAIFNENYLPEIQKGNLRSIVSKERHPSPDRSHEPYCTRSQLIEYIDNSGLIVAKAHQYFRKDGSIGGSGRPDPKYLKHEGEILIPEES